MQFKDEAFEFDLPVFFDKFIPVKDFVTLRILKNKTDKVAEYQIEITNFIGEDLKLSDLELGPATAKPAPIIVRSFKFKCMLQR